MELAARLGGILVLAVFACARGATPGTAAPGDGAPAVYRGDLTVRMLLTGELTAEDAVVLVAPNANVWPLQIRWLAEDGAEVKAGDPVVEFDNSQLASNLEEMQVRAIEAATSLRGLRAQAASEEAQARFELEQSRGQLEKARLEAEAAQLMASIERERRVLEERRAELELEEAQQRLDSRRRADEAEIEIQKIDLDTARAAVARAEAGIDKLTLRATRDGIVIFEENRGEGRAYQVGDTIWPGQTVARLPDLATMMVEARLFDVDDGRVSAGMSVRATLDAFPDRAFGGRVREIDRIAKDSGRTSLRRFFRTKIDLDQVDPERMRPGMSVKVEVETTYEGLLLARRDALDWTAGGARAFLDGEGWKPVRPDLCDAEACAVDDGSLPPAADTRNADTRNAGTRTGETS
jgi:multidrug efflux pump subunit AcrA (membrane-fusion protein)